MKNFRHPGHMVSFAAVAAVLSGAPIDLGNGLIGVAAGSYAAGEEGEYSTSGVHSFPKEAATAMGMGEAVGYDDGNANVVDSADAAKDFDLGIVTKAALAADVTVEVMVNGARGHY